MANDKPEAFFEIADLRPAKKGDAEEGMKHVQEFLYRFGYIKDKEVLKPDSIDDETSEALTKYQTCQGLPSTGEFDNTTRRQMTTARCAFPDMSAGVAFSATCDWQKAELTYAFDTGTNDVPGTDEFQANRNAFQTWAAVIPLTFREVGSGENPDVLIGWRPANDPDLSMVGGTLAHADFPPACGVVTNTLPKPVHFDDTEHTWAIGAAPGAFDVESVALHEIGHILGLAHSIVAGAIMYPSIGSNRTNRVLAQDDISGVQSLYPTPAPATVVCPNVVGLSESQAQQAITQAGLQIGTVTTVRAWWWWIFWWVSGRTRVLSQSLVSGTNVAQGSTVDLAIRRGP